MGSARGAVEVVCEADLDWREVLLEDAEPPVRLGRLWLEEGTRATRSLVRFPSGWNRPWTGSYDVAEEVLFLEGEFEMSGVRYGVGDYAWFPEGYLRWCSSSLRGALALAWFSGPPRWTRAKDVDPAGPSPTAICSYAATGGAGTSPLGPARLLREEGHDVSWITHWAADPAPGSPAGAALEIFSLASRCYAWLPAAASLPALDPPWFLRIRPQR